MLFFAMLQEVLRWWLTQPTHQPASCRWLSFSKQQQQGSSRQGLLRYYNILLYSFHALTQPDYFRVIAPFQFTIHSGRYWMDTGGFIIESHFYAILLKAESDLQLRTCRGWKDRERLLPKFHRVR